MECCALGKHPIEKQWPEISLIRERITGKGLRQEYYKRIVKYMVWSVALYDEETWTLLSVYIKRPDAGKITKTTKEQVRGRREVAKNVNGSSRIDTSWWQ